MFKHCDKIPQGGGDAQREEQCILSHCFEGFVSQSHGATAGPVESQGAMAIGLYNQSHVSWETERDIQEGDMHKTHLSKVCPQ